MSLGDTHGYNFSYLIKSSRDLAAAINSLLHYDTLVADIGTAKFSHNTEVVTICWTPNQQCSEQVVLRNMTAWVAVVRHLLDPHLAPSCLHLEHSFTQQQLLLMFKLAAIYFKNLQYGMLRFI
ncbi:AraC family transcriptional regulator ligand-binding domain-containing protein [Pseudoalteromonas prydzensis]|uniref:AraC family transcriptional regulator ligand-binding domain-containing protein n=1 Tax=Pseudoalteromonas prydzensis TaxID=182141 RepID=UPI003D2F5A0C